MAKFTPLELGLFVEHTCSRCFQPDQAAYRAHISNNGCPLLKRAAMGQFPGKWTRKRNAPLGETFKCEDFVKTPPTNRRKTSNAECEAMFDVKEADRLLVPVDGWPDYRAEAQKSREGDHQ